ncbi:MAG: TIGR01212 family radical SAM protein [Gemmataceae bacterium]
MERRYLPLSAHLRDRFGCRVRSVTIDAGFTCPNVDGTVTTGGCVYCDNRSFSPNRRLPRATVLAQVERGVAILARRYRAERFIAYFQAGTNTHAPVEKLRRLYDEALSHPLVVGLAVGTRPDSVPGPVLDLLQGYAARVPVFLELGLQTVHDRSLEWMNRGHGVAAFLDAVRRCQGRGLDVCAHVILGLPGESHADMMETADVLAGLPVGGVKLHNLYVVKDTPLERQYRDGAVRILPREEYAGLVVDFLERTPGDRVIHRLSGEAPPEYLVAPEWAADKAGFLRAVDGEFERRGTRQGDRVTPRVARRAMSLPLVGG